MGHCTFKGKTFEFAQDEVHASHWTFEDEHSIRDALWDIQPGDVVLDIGCAYGSYSLCALAAGASRILAWNPNLHECELMQKSLELNGWENRCDFYYDGLYSGVGYLNDYHQSFSATPVEGSFPVRTLDSYNLVISSPTWLKIDVEGAEVEVLKGAEQFIRAHKPKILVENHEFKAAGITHRVIEYLATLDYKLVQTIPYHSVSHSLLVP